MKNTLPKAAPLLVRFDVNFQGQIGRRAITLVSPGVKLLIEMPEGYVVTSKDIHYKVYNLDLIMKPALNLAGLISKSDIDDLIRSKEVVLL